jgi:hypothetical protein
MAILNNHSSTFRFVIGGRLSQYVKSAFSKYYGLRFTSDVERYRLRHEKGSRNGLR